jgi:uncharacterized protein YijF (DUF1287 family)
MRRRALALLLALAALAVGSAPAFATPEEDFALRLAAAAEERATHRVVYDPAYVSIAYPWGDVAPDRGVCADVLIRAYRALGVDLQTRVHEDMAAAFDAYPDTWGLTRPDPNIDHRRVLNLETFFTRHGERLAPSDDPADYEPGDIVAWNLRGDAGFLPHIGIVTNRVARSGRPMIAHNIGAGPKVEDVLFDWPMTGHYRYAVAPGEEDRPAGAD